MRRPTVEPIDSPRDFRAHELFFSTTDSRGVIEAGNAVFTRIAGYTLEELIGAPHNKIRHPDMPRAVFRLFWDHLHRNRTIAAYVKNLASDGRYYWVIALVLPIGDRYLSVRFKPTTPLLDGVEAVYGEMRRLEIEADAQGEDGDAGMNAAASYLETVLAGMGHDDYDAFMRTMLREELKHRDAVLSAGLTAVVPPLPASGGEASIRSIYEGCLTAYNYLCTLFKRLDSIVALNGQLATTSATVLELTRVFQFISLNTAIKSARLGDQGEGLGVIAGYLGGVSADVSQIVTDLTARIGKTSETLAAVIYDLASARLQTEMILVFCQELVSAGDDPRSIESAEEGDLRHRMIDDLRQAFARTVCSAIRELRTFSQDLGNLGITSEDLRKTMLALEFAQLRGLVEAYRLGEEAVFGVIFTEVRKQIEQTKKELVGLNDVTRTLAELVTETPRIAEVLEQAEERMSEQAALS